MAAKDVTNELRRQFWPMLNDLGFSSKGRSRWRHKPPITCIVAVNGLSTRQQSVARVGPGSFFVVLAVDVMGAGPVSFSAHDRIVTDYAEVRIQLELPRSSAESSSVDDCTWAIGSDFTPAEAVADLCVSFQQHGAAFFDTFGDIETAHQILCDEHESRIPDVLNPPVGPGKPFGVPILNLPGMAGSITRLTHLAVLAARLGRIDLEAKHLEDLLEFGDDQRYRSRLEQITG